MMFMISSCSEQHKPAISALTDNKQQVYFDWFEYQGNDDVFIEPLEKGTYQNPVIAGYFPDPSITKKGDDYYLVASSFVMTPALPILHSKDLVNWQLIGHGIDREEQMEFDGLSTSRGIMAPTIRYHNGLFYIITTGQTGAFYITAKDPAGSWSDPIFLPEIKGIDPDIFFDDDGKVYIAHNGSPASGELYDGHRAIWLWELDLKSGTIFKNSSRMIINGGTKVTEKPFWIEAPHIYKINGWYYLMCAEGGTGDNHSEVVFRSKSLLEPFVEYEQNPILTQRHLNPDRTNPITTAGHSDMVQDSAGKWWAVFLATRTYNKTFYNRGRETFLLPVTWKNEWPELLSHDEVIPYRLAKPSSNSDSHVEEPVTGNFIWRDDFNANKLGLHWNYLRKHNPYWVSVNNGKVALIPQAISLSEQKSVSFVSRRQQHMRYRASTMLITPKHSSYSAGIAAYQSDDFHYYFGVRKKSEAYQLFIEQVKDGVKSIITSKTIDITEQGIELVIEGDKSEISFAYNLNGKYEYISKKQDAKILSTSIAGGFVGTMLGMHTRIEY